MCCNKELNVMSLNNKKLDISSLSRMKIDDIILLYKQGYSIKENSVDEQDITSGNSIERQNKFGFTPTQLVTNRQLKFGFAGNIKSLSSCPSSIVQGTQKQITITPSGGTPPYSVSFLVDGNIVNGWTNVTGVINPIITFNQSVGSHMYSLRVVDSCVGGGKTIDETPCQINIISPTGNKYLCQNGVCVQDNVNGIFTEPTCGGTCTTTPKCAQPDQVFIPGFDQCVPKNYLLYGGLAFVALMLLK